MSDSSAVSMTLILRWPQMRLGDGFGEGGDYRALSIVRFYYYGWFILSLLMIIPHYFWLADVLKGDDELCKNLLENGTITSIHPTRL
jgi:hypothetical protein